MNNQLICCTAVHTNESGPVPAREICASCPRKPHRVLPLSGSWPILYRYRPVIPRHVFGIEGFRILRTYEPQWLLTGLILIVVIVVIILIVVVVVVVVVIMMMMMMMIHDIPRDALLGNTVH
jgi:hypothetical protein